MAEAFQLVAILSCSLFAGAALYISVAEHPARIECGADLAVTVFAPSYRRAAAMQVTLALLATISGAACWFLAGSVLWLAGTVLIFAVIPFTLVAILPTNKRLLAAEPTRAPMETYRLLKRWGYLHAVRTAAGTVASVIFVAAALTE